MRNGFPHGRATRWHANGVIAYQGYFVDGERHGTFNYWDEENRWIRLEEFVHGKLVWSKKDNDATPPARLSLGENNDDETDESPPWSWWQSPGVAWRSGFPELAPNGRSSFVARLSRQTVADHEDSIVSLQLQATGSLSLGDYGLPAVGAYLSARVPRTAADLMRPAETGRSTWETGAHYALRDDFRLRLGLMLPLASDDLEGYRAASRAMQHQVHDFVATYPRSLALRSSASHHGQYSTLTYRVDSGLDLAVDAFGDETFAMRDSSALIATLGLGVGVATPWLALSVQLDTAHPLVHSGLPDSISTISLSVQLRSEVLWPAFSIIAPLSGRKGSVVLATSLAFPDR